MTRFKAIAAPREDHRVSTDLTFDGGGENPAPFEANPPQRSPLGPFIAGTIVGGLAGTILGTALSPHTRGFVVGLYHLVSRRLSSAERDQLRFELLLQ